MYQHLCNGNFSMKINHVFFLGQTGKQRATVSILESDNKMASSGLTEKQLQLSVEVRGERNMISLVVLS